MKEFVYVEVVAGEVSFNNAKDDCEENFGKFASIKNEDEQNRAIALLEREDTSPNGVWIGLRRDPESDGLISSNFFWEDGSENRSFFTKERGEFPWGSGQPSNSYSRCSRTGHNS